MGKVVDLIAAEQKSTIIKAFFLVPSLNEEISAANEMFIDDKIKVFQNSSNSDKIRNILRWLENLQYSEFVEIENGLTDLLLENLKLETSYIKFLSMPISEIMNNYENIFQLVDLIIRNEEFLIQIARLRMIIDPEIQLSRNIHKKTNILYMKVKGFWLNENGIKERKYFKSLGKFDSYPEGVSDKNAILEGRKKIREAMYSDYLKIYR